MAVVIVSRDALMELGEDAVITNAREMQRFICEAHGIPFDEKEPIELRVDEPPAPRGKARRIWSRKGGRK